MKGPGLIIITTRNMERSETPHQIGFLYRAFGAWAKILLFSRKKVSLNNLFMQNEPNLRNDQMNVTYLLTTNYGDIRCLQTPENEPNTNPKQTQNKPKRTQSNPNLAHFTTKYTGSASAVLSAEFASSTRLAVLTQAQAYYCTSSIGQSCVTQ